MKLQKITTLFGLILIVSMLTTVAITPAQGQSYTGHKKTYAYIGATPNPVAVGEEVLLHIGISEALQITQDNGTD
jgi:hypothetical protein